MDRVELVSGTFCPYQHTLRVIFEQLSIDKGFPVRFRLHTMEPVELLVL